MNEKKAEAGKQSEAMPTPKGIKREGREEKPKSLRGRIESRGWNPNYIKEIAEAIVKEAKKENMDLGYILEKTSKIESFIDEVSE